MSHQLTSFFLSTLPSTSTNHVQPRHLVRLPSSLSINLPLLLSVIQISPTIHSSASPTAPFSKAATPTPSRVHGNPTPSPSKRTCSCTPSSSPTTPITRVSSPACPARRGGVLRSFKGSVGLSLFCPLVVHAFGWLAHDGPESEPVTVLELVSIKPHLSHHASSESINPWSEPVDRACLEQCDVTMGRTLESTHSMLLHRATSHKSHNVMSPRVSQTGQGGYRPS